MKANEVKFTEESEVNGSQLAKHLGVSPQYIQKLKNQGVLKFIDKKIIIKDAIKSIKDNSNPARAYKKKEEMEKAKNEKESEQIYDLSDSDILNLPIKDFLKKVEQLNFNDAKTRSEQLNLITKKIAMEKELMNLVPKDGIEKNAFDLAKKLKDSLLAIPDRLCDILASETDARIIHTKITEEIKQTLEEIILDLTKKMAKDKWKD